MHEIILIDEYSRESIRTAFEVVKSAETALNRTLENMRRDMRRLPYISRYDISTALGFKQIPSSYIGITIYKDKCIRFKNGMSISVTTADELPTVELRLYDCVCDLDEATRKLERKLSCLALNSQYGVSPSVNVNAYSKALAEFYSKEREDMDFYDCSDMTDFIGGHVFRDRVNQVDLAIKKVIFNDPATIVLWKDGSKTVVKCGDHEKYDPEKGFAMALAKRYLGNRGRYYELFKRHLPEKTFEPDDEVLVRAKLVGPLSPKKGNTKYIIKLPGHAAAVSLDQEYLVEVEG